MLRLGRRVKARVQVFGSDQYGKIKKEPKKRVFL